MIIAVKDRMRAPFDPAEIYVLQLGVSRPPLWSDDSFFFASEDGNSLIHAIDQKDRLVEALQAAATEFATFPCATSIQSALTRLTYVPPPPPPQRLPKLGDTAFGVAWHVRGPLTIQIHGVDTVYYCGLIYLDAGLSGYDFPRVNNPDDVVLNYLLGYSTLSNPDPSVPVVAGKVKFDYAEANSGLKAVNIRNY